MPLLRRQMNSVGPKTHHIERVATTLGAVEHRQRLLFLYHEVGHLVRIASCYT